MPIYNGTLETFIRSKVWKKLSFFLGLKVLDSKNSYIFPCSLNLRFKFVEKPQLKMLNFQKF